MPTLDRPDGTLVYDVTGSGPPLFLVTGLGGSRGYWSNLLPQLAEKFTVVTHDHMGTGETRSRRTTHRVEALAADVTALMDDLGIAKTHLVGHSTGAAVGQIMGQDCPERLDKLVLYAGWAGPDPFFDLCFVTRKILLTSSGIEAYHQGSPLFLYPPRWISEDGDRLKRLIAMFIATSPPAAVMAARVDMLLAFDRRARMGEIAVPTLVLCAEDDFLTPMHCSEELAAGIAGARLARLTYGGHAASQTNAADFLAALNSFL
ncbi:alpha/beta fold hydrolase [Beijerinckia sp. L45]|uniref:alpha/beta fold hydrolase n=1 Tax=Beijerinckia sp. L45 TaxID=1641855 RepID=UPI00131CFF51|nr:alpha/beta fold hydrolase [Beijerinckia sp. L45]